MQLSIYQLLASKYFQVGLRILFFQSFFALFLLLFILGCNKEKKERSAGFVQVHPEGFSLKGEPFFPIMLNYITNFRLIKDSVTISAAMDYEKYGEYEYFTKKELQAQIDRHFKLIKSMGFNSLRLVGLSSLEYQKNYPAASYSYIGEHGERDFFSLRDNKKIKELKTSLQQLIDLAEKNELKVMLLLPRPRKQDQFNYERLSFIKQVLILFKDNPTVFAYDFFNEPLYFDNSEWKEFYNYQRRKETAYELVTKWRQLMNKNAPNQLFTIGFAEPLEVFEWDPGILDIDFVSFHTYHPLRVPNEIYWYAKNAKKPWMITETALPAEDDSISYSSQAIFMKEVLQRTIDCGGSGFGWWQFQDVNWGPFEHNYTALLNHQGKIELADGEFIYGSIKPAVNALQNFDFKVKNECVCWNNYYNMLGYKNYLLKGVIVDAEMNEPIEDAVIRGWTNDWKIGANTFSKLDGSFTLYSNKPFVNFEVSAIGKETEKFLFEPDYLRISPKKEIALGNEDLEYAQIHYQRFLKEESKNQSVFTFEDSLFNQFQYQAKMPLIQLTTVKIE